MNFKSGFSILTGNANSVASFGAKSTAYQPQISNIIKQGTRNTGNKKSVDPDYKIIDGSTDKYLQLLKELKHYLESDITKTLLDIIKDTLSDLFLEGDKIITIKDQPELETKLNAILNSMGIVSEIKSSLPSFLYYGSHSTGITSSNEDFKLKYLKNPQSVIYIRSVDDDGFILLDSEGGVNKLEEEKIFYLSTNDYYLDLDTNMYEGDDKDDLFIKNKYSTGTPLFSGITVNVKEYILKEYLLAILSIKDLIQPILLLIGLDKNTDLTDALTLSSEIEDLINKNVDMSYLESKGLSIKELANSLIDNIRVLPDYDSKLAGMSDLNLDKLYDKIERVRGDQQGVREKIVVASGVSYDLVEGRSTKWEALKTNQRFHSKINYYADAINESVERLCYSLLKDDSDIKKVRGKISVNVVAKSTLSSNKESAHLDSINTTIRGVSDLVDTMERLSQSEDVNKANLRKYVDELMSKFDVRLSGILTDNKSEEPKEVEVKGDSNNPLSRRSRK